MLTVLRWVLFAISVTGVSATAERLVRRATDRGDLRVVGGGVLVVAVAVTEVLLAGTISLGGNGLVIAGVAVAVAVATRLVVPASGPSSTELARNGWAGSGIASRALLAAAAGVTIVETTYLMFRPAIGTDGLISHLGEPAMWVTDGQPGSMHSTISGFAFQAYPKTGEVLFAWAIGTARTPVATSFIMVGALVLGVVAAWSALRRLGVEQWVAAVIASSLGLSPIMIAQIGGPNTDLFTLTWILCIGALCIGAMAETGLLPVALVCGGVAVGTRTTAVPVVIVVLAVTFWLRRRDVTAHIVSLVAATATTLGLGIVWYLQDLAVYHAPLFPFSSFPDGPPVPAVVAAEDATFLHDPRGAIRVAHISGYSHALGGGLALGLGVVLAAVLLPTVRDRRLQRVIGIAVLASTAEALIWSVTPYTGFSGNPATGAVYVLAGTRYLMPGIAVFAVTVGLASRANGTLGIVAKVVALAAVAADLWALRAFQLGSRPAAVTLVAAGLIGGGAATLNAVRRPNAAVWSATSRFAVSGLLAIATIAVATGATRGYLNRHIALARQLHIDAPDLLVALENRPEWNDTHLPVAIGPVANALLAGPTFNHPLQVIEQGWTCDRVAAAARQGWVLLPTKSIAPQVPGADPYDRIRCLAGVTPTFTSDGLSVFAPPTK